MSPQRTGRVGIAHHRGAMGIVRHPDGGRRPPCGLAALLVISCFAFGCQTAPKPIFAELDPALVWPAPPDVPRIRYVGALAGESSLGAQPRGWDAFKAIVAGPPPTVEFVRPSAVAVDGERVYVSDPGLGLVHLLDLAQRRYVALRGNPADPLRAPIDLGLGPDRSLVVVDSSRAAVDLFTADGTWRATKRWPEITRPVAVAWDSQQQTYWLADAAAHACFAIAGWNEIRLRLGVRGAAPGQFNFPTALACHARLGLVVADAMNFRVQVFEPPYAAPRVVFGRKGDAAGDFARPRAVACDSDGHIYVVDNQFENVQVFDRDGRLLLAWGREGRGPGEFFLPAGITIDERDRIWVADDRRVQVFQYLKQATPPAQASPPPATAERAS